LVSVPFTFVVASRLDLQGHFLIFYLVITVTALILAIFMPRIWPLCRIKDDYVEGVGKQIDEEVPEGVSMFSQALTLATERAEKTTPVTVVKSGLTNWLNIFMDLIPVILAWGTVALVINEQTPVFDILAWPFQHLLNLFRIEGAETYAPVAIVGFIDMYLPAILMGSDAPINTRFILGTLSIVQIIYMAETGILILKSKIPLNIGHLAIIFLMRTVFALPIIVLLTHLLFHP